MLVAVGVDTNDQLFPLSFVIVEGVNNESWDPYMACMRARVTLRSDVIFNRHRGTIVAMNDEYLGWGVERARHQILCSTFCHNVHCRFYDNSLKMLFVRAAYEHHPCKFEYRREQVALFSTTFYFNSLSIAMIKLKSGSHILLPPQYTQTIFFLFHSLAL